MDGQNNQNLIMAIVLSVGVLILWQMFYAGPKIRKEQERRQRQIEQVQPTQPGTSTTPSASTIPGTSTPPSPSAAPTTGAQPAPGTVMSTPVAGNTREAALALSPRLAIDTPSLSGSIALKGGRIDDLTLIKYNVSTEPGAANVVLFSPSGSPDPYYAEYGWVAGEGSKVKLPTQDTVWQAETPGALSATNAVTIKWDNGEGVTFRRTISLDENYMFTVRQSLENSGSTAVTVHPYALLSRHGQPKTTGFYILHEGLIGVLGEDGLQEIDYDDAIDESVISFEGSRGWLGITDKYWAAALVPDQKTKFQARFTGTESGERKFFQADYLMAGATVAPGGSISSSAKLFAGAKQVKIIDNYEKDFGIENFDLLIDWGWFYFITKPLFWMLDWFYQKIGNFGVAILLATVVVKLAFFPLANKSYVSMSKMKGLQPEINKLRDRFKDDRARQQQEMMELYKKEKINPMSGCLPVVLQIPVFFALYKVLFVSIEMRHAPFYGWIKDLSAPDPTSLFNLFGLIPWSPPQMLMVGVWPLLMGITMFLQMRLNPTPADPVQQKIFTWMPLFFTFLLASFPAGLVIYWTWNNLLSIIQQWTIMSRQGVKVELWGNVRESLPWLFKKS